MRKNMIAFMLLAACMSLPAAEIVNLQQANPGHYAPVTQEFVFDPDRYDTCDTGFVSEPILKPDIKPAFNRQLEIFPYTDDGTEPKLSTRYVNRENDLWFFYRILSRGRYQINVTVGRLTPDRPEDGYFDVSLYFYTDGASSAFAEAHSADGSAARLLNETGATPPLIRTANYKVQIVADSRNRAGKAAVPKAPLYDGYATIEVVKLV